MDRANTPSTPRLTRRNLLTLVGGAWAAGALGPWTRIIAADGSTPAAAAARFELPPLPYPFDALEPVIDAETMRLHHGKHHAGYVANLNAAVDRAPELRGRPVEELLVNLDSLPESVRQAVRNHGGGHANHTLFWQCLTPGGAPPDDAFAAAVNATFGNLQRLQERFTGAAMAVFGSGWAWLVLDGGRLAITTTPNQDSPLTQRQRPLLGVDVWEHAYYLKYQNRRSEYLANLWRVVNWRFVAANWRAATA